MATVQRISPQEAHDRVASGQALLVCAYDDEQKCRHYHLEGALSLSEFRSQESSVPRDKEIIFYCA